MNNKLLQIVLSALVGGALILIGVLYGGGKVGPIGPVGPVGPFGAVSGPEFPGPFFAINGLQRYVSSGDWKAGTTTVVSVNNPTGATMTVGFLGLTNTFVATSTYRLACGTSYLLATSTASTLLPPGSAPRVSSNPTNSYLNVGTVATGTLFWNVGYQASSTVYLGPSQTFYCVAQGANGEDSLRNNGGFDSAFTNSATTTFGTFKLELIQ